MSHTPDGKRIRELREKLGLTREAFLRPITSEELLRVQSKIREKRGKVPGGEKLRIRGMGKTTTTLEKCENRENKDQKTLDIVYERLHFFANWREISLDELTAKSERNEEEEEIWKARASIKRAIKDVRKLKKWEDLIAKEASQPANQAHDEVLPVLEALISASSIPMYFANAADVIEAYSPAFVELINGYSLNLKGKHILQIVDKYILERAPAALKRYYEEEQRELVRAMAEGFGQSPTKVVFLDNSDRICQFGGLRKVWVHATKVKSPLTGKPAGVFVVCHAEKTTKQALAAEIRRVEKLSKVKEPGSR